MERPLLPGGTIGILGGGQLGRMSAIAARRMGYKVKTFDPSAEACAAAIADEHVAAEWNDTAALTRFAQGCGRITLEFENIPPATVEFLAQSVPSHPSANVLAICQNRRREKEFLRASGIPCANFAVVVSLAELQAAVKSIGFPCVLKTADFGYDGKGQARLKSPQDAATALADMAGAPAILEGFVSFTAEISIIAARNPQGEVACYDPGENIHRDGILHTTTVPAKIPARLRTDAVLLAAKILNTLDYVGVMGVELFVTPQGLIVNEIAPRVHNSGHWTQNGCAVDQFEQHIRAIAGWPLGDGSRHSDVTMENLIGKDMDKVPALAREANCALHLYGKVETKAGRKMGHVNRIT